MLGASWNKTGMERFHHLNAFLEHAGVVGGFVIVAVVALSGHANTPD